MKIEMDTSGFKKYRMALGNAAVEAHTKAALSEAVALALRKVKERTPIRSGTLRREWKVTDITKEGDNWVVTLYNDTKYAPYVEYGHRTRLNRKTGERHWVEGQFMMKISCDEVKADMNHIVQKHVMAMLAEMGFK